MLNGVEYKHLILFDNDHQQTKTYINIKLTMQSVPIITYIVSSNSCSCRCVLDPTLYDKVCDLSVVFSRYTVFHHL